MTVNSRYDQVRIIRVFDDGIAGVPWLHVGCTDDVRGRTKAGPLHNAGSNFGNVRPVISDSSTVPPLRKELVITTYN